MSRILSIPGSYFPQFDELYVISDLHLGGSKDFQIFDASNQLEGFIKFLCSIPSEKKVALLINGDMVDFLAEKPALTFDPLGAVDKLNRIIEESNFKPIWKQLQKFVNIKNRNLIINLGNHDLELALPWVRSHLLKVLSSGNEVAYSRIIFSFDGAGYRCRVGNAEVLCVHGNEVDGWNVTDYEMIRKISREIMQRRPVDDWIPNAGTQLVVQVMNSLKSQYPFIDLLKPEKQAVIPTLLALAPDQRDKLQAIALTASRLFKDKLKIATGFLGDDQSQSQTLTSSSDILSITGSNADKQPSTVMDFGTQKHTDALLKEAEERLYNDINPMALIRNDQRGEYLGMGAALIKFARGEDTFEVLREALQELNKDRSFDFTNEDETYQLLDEKIGDGPEFIVAGHTHLERALPRKRARGWYFNSGTWVRLIKLNEQVLSNSDQFKEIINAFKIGSMKNLDDFPSLVIRKLTVVAIWSENQQTHGELRHITTGPTFNQTSVVGSHFVTS